MAKPKLHLRRLTPIILALSIGLVFQSANAAEFTLMPSPQTVHIGHFSAALKPVLTVESGDTVVLVASDHLDPAVTDQSGVVPPSAVPEYVRSWQRRSAPRTLEATRPWTVDKTYRRGTTKYLNWSRFSCLEGTGSVTINKEYYLVGGDGSLMPTRKGQLPPFTRYFAPSQK